MRALASSMAIAGFIGSALLLNHARCSWWSVDVFLIRETPLVTVAFWLCFIPPCLARVRKSRELLVAEACVRRSDPRRQDRLHRMLQAGVQR
ncbi:MAG TPA: hypothetical protein VE981_22335 [Planctomycetota bacterium]|nr:hypothetical protein [Planctomycetota bacterium]